MKKFFTLFFYIILLTIAAKANTVYVYGYVKNTAGTAIPNQAVYVYNDSLVSGASCGSVIYHVKYTNSNGFYSDTLTCSGTITSVKISTSNCLGSIITNTIAVGIQGGNYQSDFVTSCSNNPTCTANFNYSITNSGTAQFVNTSTTSSTITNVFWNFGDGSSSTQFSPVHNYAAVGTYMVKLKILSNGCADSIIKAITISSLPQSCNANFNLLRDSLYYNKVYLFAGVNTQYPNSDPIVERKWKFGDGDSLLGNVQNPTHTYTSPGTYTICLRVKTQNGCISDTCKTVVLINPALNNCYANYSFVPQSTLVSFNSNSSFAMQGDSIVSRRWVWGDSSVALTGNVVAPQHQYAQPGVYNVCLTIKTASGCEKTICKLVTATNSVTNCVPQFTTTRTAIKTIAFNSSMSWSPINDSIIERKWSFGDGTGIATGNLVNAQHSYLNNGIYTACLRIKTAKGCINEVCKPILVQDSVNNPPNGVNEPVKILVLYPNPARVNLLANIWCANNSIAAELSIYDVYGVKKWTRNTTLLQGNNIANIAVNTLLPGPYIFKVKTIYGTKSRQFFKF